MKLLATLLILLCYVASAQSIDCRRGKGTSDSPISGTVFAVMNAGRVQRIQGRVFYPNGEVLIEQAVVEVFVNPLETNAENLSYAEVSKISSGRRVAAYMIENDGKFCIRNLSAGKYLLRIGTRNNPAFSTMNILVRLAPRGKRSSSKMLRVELPLSI